jgi:hypothetical protein
MSVGGGRSHPLLARCELFFGEPRPMQQREVFSCGADKGTERAPLFDLYRGPMWRTLNTQIGAIPRENVMVISGKLGFVPASTRAKSYEQQMT